MNKANVHLFDAIEQFFSQEVLQRTNHVTMRKLYVRLAVCLCASSCRSNHFLIEAAAFGSVEA